MESGRGGIGREGRGSVVEGRDWKRRGAGRMA
jgi:hypothetical protein